jgi:hypothetical protein
MMDILFFYAAILLKITCNKAMTFYIEIMHVYRNALRHQNGITELVCLKLSPV